MLRKVVQVAPEIMVLTMFRTELMEIMVLMGRHHLKGILALEQELHMVELVIQVEKAMQVILLQSEDQLISMCLI